MTVPWAVVRQMINRRGDAWEWTATVQQTAFDGSVSPVDLTSYGTFTAQARSSEDAATAVDIGIDVTNAASGVLVLSLSGAQTAGMVQPDTGGDLAYGFDVQATGGTLSPDTPMVGSLLIVKDYTHG